MTNISAQIHRSVSIEMYIIIKDLEYDDKLNTYIYTIDINIDGELTEIKRRYTEIRKLWYDVLSHKEFVIPHDIVNMSFPGKLLFNSFENVKRRMDKMNDCLAQLCRISKLRNIPEFISFLVG